MSYSRPLPTFPPGRPAAAAVPVPPSRAPRPPHAPLTMRMRTGHWIAIDFVVAGFAALFVMASVRPYVLHSGQAWFPVALLVAAGVVVPVALRRRAPMMAFGGLLVLAVMVSGMTMAAAAVILLA